MKVGPALARGERGDFVAGLVFLVSVQVRDDEFLGNFGRDVAEANLSEDSVWESFAKGFRVGYVVGEEDYVGNVCRCQARCPFRDWSMSVCILRNQA